MTSDKGIDPDVIIKALTPMESAVKKLNDSMRAEREAKLRNILMSFITEHSLEEARQILASFKCDRLAQCLKLSPVDFSALIGRLLGRGDPTISVSTTFDLLAEFRMSWAKHGAWSIALGNCGNPECLFCGAQGDFLIRVDAALEREVANTNLIAAAPDMYEALQKIANGTTFKQDAEGDCISDARSVALAALAKAEGKSNG